MTRPRPYTLLIAAAAAALLTPTGPGATAATLPPPTYRNYPAPDDLAAKAPEPSIGVNWKTGAVFLQARYETDKMTFSGADTASWTNVSSPFSRLVSLDPLLYSDVANGRVFVSQLIGFDSITSFTDNDGITYRPSQGGGIPSGVDHQSIGSGPYPPGSPFRPLASFPNAVYYCSQEMETAFCARSDDGGVTFGPGVPIYTALSCAGIHGHVRVSPDGTAYVPNRYCNGRQGLAVSADAGLTWTVRTIPGSTANTYIIDPSAAPARDNTLYVGWVQADGRPEIAVTRDRGKTFTEPVDVGTPVGVKNATFPEVIAGDGDRAAFAFLGTSTGGNAQDPKFGKDGDSYSGALYHLYISTTFDRGTHWTTIDATGADPVQRGRICNSGITCSGPDRNLADFMDIQVDKAGRVLVGWADGCTGDCSTSKRISDNTRTAKGTITRQSGGTPLFASGLSDPIAVAPPAGRPGRARAGKRSTPGLAATGPSFALPLLALGLVVVAGIMRRRRT